MSKRRESIDRQVEREEARLERSLERGSISTEEYQQELRDLHREAIAEAREAYLDDIQDCHRDWFYR